MLVSSQLPHLVFTFELMDWLEALMLECHVTLLLLLGFLLTYNFWGYSKYTSCLFVNILLAYLLGILSLI